MKRWGQYEELQGERWERESWRDRPIGLWEWQETSAVLRCWESVLAWWRQSWGTTEVAWGVDRLG